MACGAMGARGHGTAGCWTRAPARSGGVCLGGHVVPAPGGRDPGEEAGGGLFQLPAILLFDLMMPATGWPQIARARGPAQVVWDRVVQVRVPGWLSASGKPAGLVPGQDDGSQPGGRTILRFVIRVRAGTCAVRPVSGSCNGPG